jgi:hypothetical protein
MINAKNISNKIRANDNITFLVGWLMLKISLIKLELTMI